MNNSAFVKKYLLARFLIVMIMLQIMRLIFFIVNREMFLSDTAEIVSTFVKSLMFDFLSTFLYFTLYISLVFIFLFLNKIYKW